ncbi:integrase [Streptomyces sp. NPDC006551]|uniref:integrase n=1 Tax=Streptomyces sp. NPDC006551 TaxID=3157178 RepID=UPI0033B9D71D
MSDEVEVVDAELVDDDHLPAVIGLAPAARPVVDRHTILMPGETLPTADDQPRYTERDLYVSEETAERLKNHAQPKNTNRNYRSQRGIFERWCEDMGRVARPCTTATFIEYVASMIARDASPNTISAHMSAIRTWMPDDKKPGTAVARGMLNEHRKDWGKRKGVRKAPAITDDMLRAMVETCDLRHPIGIRDRCALLLGRGALNRRIELADLAVPEVLVDDDFVTLLIAYSKTDQAGVGVHTDIPAEPGDPLMCPVRATRDWLNMLHRLGVREGAFFRALTVAGTLQSRATATERGDFVTGDAVNDWVRGRAHKAGLENWQSITGHGLRRGGAQAIADAGGDPTDQGRWKPGSAVVKREYLDRARSRAENPWLQVQAKRREETRGSGQ